MFGYACERNDELMPLPIVLAHKLGAPARRSPQGGLLPFLRGWQSQVRWNMSMTPPSRRLRVISRSIVNSYPIAIHESIVKESHPARRPSRPLARFTHKFHINPTGRLRPVGGRWVTVCGCTRGEKVIVD